MSRRRRMIKTGFKDVTAVRSTPNSSSGLGVLPGTQYIDTGIHTTRPSTGYRMVSRHKWWHHSPIYAQANYSLMYTEVANGDGVLECIEDTGHVSVTATKNGNVATAEADTFVDTMDETVAQETDGGTSVTINTGQSTTSWFRTGPSATPKPWNQHIYLFGRAADKNKRPVEVYEFSYAEGGEELIHLVPRVDIAGRAGMYDKVSHKIIYSSGSEDLTAVV